jgi:low affinity Fe/Cu permease
VDLNKVFARLAGAVAHATGTPIAFCLCLMVVAVWGFSGPLFGYSDTWQLVINTGTTIVTFLMVFLIQNTQNRDGAAIQIKLDELILTSKAENEFIGIEKLTDKELEALRARCAQAAANTQKLAEKAAKELHARRTGDKAKVEVATSSGLASSKAAGSKAVTPKGTAGKGAGLKASGMKAAPKRTTAKKKPPAKK